MGVARVISYPFIQAWRGVRNNLRLNARARELGYFYDIASRLVRSYGLPRYILTAGKKVPAYTVMGDKLMAEASRRGISLKGASLGEFNEEVAAAIEASFPAEIKPLSLSKEKLDALRITLPARESTAQKFKRKFYDTFVPVKSARALDVLLGRELGKKRTAEQVEEQMRSLENEKSQLLEDAREKIRYLGLGHVAYMEIMSAIYKSGRGKSLEENIAEMFDVVTRWAYQVIGRSPDSEAAGWLAVGPDGKIGTPYEYVVAEKDLQLQSAAIRTLRRKGPGEEMELAIPESQTVERVNDERGRYLAVEEWKPIKLREDLVVVEKKDGERRLYRRSLRPASAMVKHLAKGAVGEKAGKAMAQLAGAFAGALTEVVGKIKAYENAFVELEEVEADAAGLLSGEVVPFVREGTVIKLVSAGSNNPRLREEKIGKGQMLEETCRKGGLEVGVVTQQLASALGNVRASALKPVSLMIADVDNFHVRPQNKLLIKIVGVESYYIRSLLEFNERGEAICLGCLEVTNPEVIPAKLNQKDEERLISQFLAGRIFADLASTGIMIKLLQEEINNLTRSYLGPKIYEVVKARQYHKLQGVKVEDASVMFADVSGFTALSDILKDRPEKVVYLLSNLFSRLDPIVVRNGGMVDKHDGDCIMADFGVPDRQAGDVDASVRAAVELMRELQAINLLPEMREMYDKYQIKPLGMTIGVNTGMIIAGNLGHAGSKIEFSVIGDAVNQAARLQHAVVRGQVLIGKRTFELLSPEFKQELVDDFNFYNRDVGTLRAFIREEYSNEGKKINEAEIDRKLKEYLRLYRDATLEDLFVPSAIWAKNKGAVPCFYLRWDRHAYRYYYLKKAGIEFEMKAVFEHQPVPIEATLEMFKEESPSRQTQLRAAFAEAAEAMKK